MAENTTSLVIPGTDIAIRPGYTVRLGRFKKETWRVGFGWFTWGNNRPFCGWYLTDTEDNTKVKPIQSTDLDDIYIITAE